MTAMEGRLKSSGMARDTVIVAVASIAVAVAVIVREKIIASSFGVGDVTDAFSLASSVIVFLASTLGGSLALSLIPTLMRIETESGVFAAEELCRALLARFLIGMVIVAVCLYILSEPVVSMLSSRFSSDKQQLTHSYFLMMLPLLPLAGWAAYATALLNARHRFLFSTMAPAVIPISVVFVFLTTSTAYALASGMVLGYLVLCILLTVSLKQEIRWLLPKWTAPPSALRAVWQQYLPVTIGSVFMGSTVVTDQVMAGWLGPGSVATLAFASILVNYLNAFGGRVLGAPALSHFSKLTALKEWAEASRLMWRAIFIIGGIALAITGFVCLFSNWLVAQLFEGGQFSAVDTSRVAEVQKYYALQLTFQFVGILLVRMLSALGKNTIILAVAAFNFFANIFLNYVLMGLMGVAGIALASSIVLCISALLCGATVWRSINAASN